MSSTVASSNQRQQSKGSAYRLDSGQRKLPPPIVFWSDNERDAFRRNKIVQTRYSMIVDDIENERRSSAKSIRHETHKYRVRSSKYRTPDKRTKENEGTAVEKDCPSARSEKSEKHKGDESADDSLSDCSSDLEEEKTPKEKVEPKRGIITKHKKPSVKFSVYKEFIPGDNRGANENFPEKGISAQIRSLSAHNQRQIPPELPRSCPSRSRSALPDAQRPLSLNSDASRPNSSVLSREGKSPTSGGRRSSMFFDKSVAAFELRKELQRLARLRKNTVVVTPYTITDALRDERVRYSESRQKVQAYLQKLEAIKKEEGQEINKWTQSEVEQTLHLQ